VEGFPYPGAKPYFLIEERLDDRDWLSRLVEATAREVPEPKLKKPGGSGKAGKTGKARKSGKAGRT
jgi:hypothetical protein